MKIAICDGDARELARLSDIIDTYRKGKPCVTYKAFSDTITLLDEMRENNFDLLLLDVLMPTLSGMQAAHEIRSFDENVRIVFLTTSPEFALESYSVNAYTYILKPVAQNALFAMLDKLLFELEEPEDTLTVRFKSGVASLRFSKISHVEVMNKTLYFNLSDGSCRELLATLGRIEKILLPRPEFLKVHRSFIINMQHVQEIQQMGIITHQGRLIPVSRRLYTTVKEQYLKFLLTR